MKKILIILSLFLSTALMAQNETDALRYSRTFFGGTARYQSMGGAFGAVGADFSTLSTNPAGIGLFKSSELSITPSIFINNTVSNYNNTRDEDSKYNFNFDNIGGVLVFDNQKENGWVNFQLGFGYNRLKNFNNRMMIEGYNDSNSLLTQYLDNITGVNPDDLQDIYPFDIGLAYEADLIFTDTLGNYYSDMPNGGMLQRKTQSSHGYLDEAVLSFGANYSDKLFIGVTLGFPRIYYSEQSSYSEIDTEDDSQYFKSFTINNNLKTTGRGFNLKFGMIFKPVDWLRLGAAVHTPTFYDNMTDTWYSSVNSQFDDLSSYYANSPDGAFDYQLQTPMRSMGNIAFIVGNHGLISADIEFVDYSDARLREEQDFYEQNNAISDKYTTQTNYHIGTEWKIENIYLRGGYAFYGSPYKNNINDAERTYYTFGMGFRDQNYFLDLAYVVSNESSDYYLYDSEYVNPVRNDFKNTKLMVSFGLKF